MVDVAPRCCSLSQAVQESKPFSNGDGNASQSISPTPTSQGSNTTSSSLNNYVAPTFWQDLSTEVVLLFRHTG